MTGAALYARFSSDLQRDRSIDDQLALCRAYAERSGLAVVATYEDRARSGASIFGRDGLLALMERARSRDRSFDVVIVEALDRLSRDQEDLAGIYKRLSFAGVEIRAVHDGRADQVQVGIRGLVGALYLQDLAQKVRRGMAGVVRDGRHAGGRAYGYRPVPGEPGRLAVVEAEAAIVRRIFAAYAGGASPREIAGDLNREGVAPPRGRYWAAATINGNTKRGHGILQNPVYAGRLVWNRVRMVKDPETGRRVSRVNDAREHHEVAAPHLAIVEPELFTRTQSLKAGRAKASPQERRRPKHPLSGLLRCACCGAGMSLKDRDHGRPRIMCTQAKEARSCENRRPYFLDAIERTVLGGLREKLADRGAIELYVRAYNEERRALAVEAGRGRARAESRLAAIRREIDRTVDLLVRAVLADEDGRERLATLKAERAGIEADVGRMGEAPKVVALHPRAIDAYLAAVGRLEDAVRSGLAVGGESAKALRDLVEVVVVHPPVAGQVAIEVRGRLTSLLGPGAFPAGELRGGSVVAEEGLEPPTRGL